MCRPGVVYGELLKSYPCYRAPSELPRLLRPFFKLSEGVLDKNVKCHAGWGILPHWGGKMVHEMAFTIHWDSENGVVSHGGLEGVRIEGKPFGALRPKTKPRVIASYKGMRKPPWAYALVVRHPGTKPRLFGATIYKRRQKKFAKDAREINRRVAKELRGGSR